MQRLKAYLAMRSVDDLWSHHTAVMAEFGFDRLFYAYSAFRRAGTFGDPDDALIFTNHDPQYVEAFVDKGLFRAGPMMNWANVNVGAMSWRIVHQEIKQRELSDAERTVMALNARYGLVAGYTIAFPIAKKYSHAGIGLTAKSGLSHEDVDAIWARDGEVIEILNHIAHLCISQLPATGQSRVLTRRQTEVLELVADGKTIQDIALLLERNAATVEKHLRGARDTLGVETTAQAVRKASVLNQIFLLEPTENPRQTVGA